MKKWNMFFAVLLVFLLACVFPFAAVADDSKQVKKNQSVTSSDGEEVKGKDSVKAAGAEDELLEEDEEEQDVEKIKPWIEAKNLLEQEKDAIEVLKDGIEDQIMSLEEQQKAAEESGNTTLEESLKAQIEQLKLEQNTYKEQMKEKLEAMHQVMKQKYTQEELDELELLSEQIASSNDVKVIPVTNILLKNRDIKFDTPPVIKEGRILIPLRAISNAIGAAVDWNSEEKTITITKDDKQIILTIDENKILVNGVESSCDVPAQLLNNRTVVPLRFIVENLDLQVDWDAETETVEIE